MLAWSVLVPEFLGTCSAAQPAPIAESEIVALEAALEPGKRAASSARRGLSVRRVIRAGDALLSAHPEAPNRFLALSVLFRGRQELVELDNSARNREALLDTCRLLAGAPDEYAAIRLDADLLISQTMLARQGGGLESRGDALLALVKRYRDTEVEARVLRLGLLMAIEFGDKGVVSDIREIIAQRFAGDLELIIFLREQLKGQVFGAPFVGTFKQTDGKTVRFPMDGLGQTAMMYFWTKENRGLEDLASLAKTCKESATNFANRLRIISFNLDDLPDAGEKHLRDLGVDWPALHVPGGRSNLVFKAYGRGAPCMVVVTPPGYAAFFMTDSKGGGVRDYTRWSGSTLARVWNQPRYSAYLRTLFAGEFLIHTGGDGFDPASPPELKGWAYGRAGDNGGLKRTAASIPEETLQAIQDCFVAPPLGYRTPPEELGANYEKADALCRQAIADHSKAPDLWLVRNRRMIALLGLWKLKHDLAYFDGAVSEAKAVQEADVPLGGDLIARFCLARQALRVADVDTDAIIGPFLASSGDKPVSGPSLAVAALLALDVADRGLHEQCRQELLEKHAENPMIWSFTSFLLDRHTRYWQYRAPYTGGWSFGRRQSYYMKIGQSDEVSRSVDAQLQTLDDKPFRIPQDTVGKSTAILFTGVWEDKGDKVKSPLPLMVSSLVAYTEKRAIKDFEVIVAFVADDAAAVRGFLKENPVECRTLIVPDGVKNPLLHQLGFASEDILPNALILRPDGSVAEALSGFAMKLNQRGGVIQNVVEWQDERAVIAALEKGDVAEAKRIAFTLAPPEDPNPVIEPKRKPKKPVFSPAHLRSRARVYMALGDLDAALKDAQEVVKRRSAKDAGMSMRTEELYDAEELRDRILQKQTDAKK